jgi:uroporphyrinogen-III synthase
VLAVGAETARAARDAGFAVAAVGEGGLAEVARHLAPGRYCACRAPIRCRWVPPGVVVDTITVYAARPCPLGGGAAPAGAALRGGPALGRSGAPFCAAECARLAWRAARWPAWRRDRRDGGFRLASG